MNDKLINKSICPSRFLRCIFSATSAVKVLIFRQIMALSAILKMLVVDCQQIK
jgi:hypothetical protein